MKQRLDVVFGLLSWVIAITIAHQVTIGGYSLVPWGIAFLIGPAIWLILFLIAFHLSKKPIRRLWWIWLSAPLGLLPWLMMAMVIIISETD